MTIQSLCDVPTVTLRNAVPRLEPTEWDVRTVQEDLIEFVRTSGQCNGTPKLRITAGELTLISGQPFVAAALACELRSIICMVEFTHDKITTEHNLTPISVREAQTRTADTKDYTMLFFSRELDDVEKSRFNKAVADCLNRDFHFVKSGKREIATSNTALNLEYGHHRRFLREIADYPLSSINGFIATKQ